MSCSGYRSSKACSTNPANVPRDKGALVSGNRGGAALRVVVAVAVAVVEAEVEGVDETRKTVLLFLLLARCCPGKDDGVVRNDQHPFREGIRTNTRNVINFMFHNIVLFGFSSTSLL